MRAGGCPVARATWRGPRRPGPPPLSAASRPSARLWPGPAPYWGRARTRRACLFFPPAGVARGPPPRAVFPPIPFRRHRRRKDCPVPAARQAAPPGPGVGWPRHCRGLFSPPADAVGARRFTFADLRPPPVADSVGAVRVPPVRSRLPSRGVPRPYQAGPSRTPPGSFLGSPRFARHRPRLCPRPRKGRGKANRPQSLYTRCLALLWTKC